MGPRRLTSSSTLRVRRDGSLRLAVVSDTHSTPHPALAGLIKALGPDAILHAGDVGKLNVLDDLSAIAPLLVVRGNVDGRAPDLPDVLHIDVVSAEHRVLRVLMTHIALYGPVLRKEVALAARREQASLVVCGHSHVPFIGRDGSLTVFNPGSAGPRRFRLPIVFGTIEVGSVGIRLGHVDCESGKPWVPPAKTPLAGSGAPPSVW